MSKVTKKDTISKSTRGVFVGGRFNDCGQDPEMVAFGYVKPEGKRWVAICVNLSLVAQAESAEDALEKMVESIESYVDFVKAHHPDDWQLRLRCDSPVEYRREFEMIVAKLAEVLKRGKSKKSTKACGDDFARTMYRGSRTFVEPIPSCHA